MTLGDIQVQATGTDDMDEEVVHEEAFTKDATGEANTSTDHHTNHQSETSRYNLTILVRS